MGRNSFLDDNKGLRSSMGLEVIGTSMDLTQFIENYDLFIGIGNNAIRKTPKNWKITVLIYRF